MRFSFSIKANQIYFCDILIYVLGLDFKYVYYHLFWKIYCDWLVTLFYFIDFVIWYFKLTFFRLWSGLHFDTDYLRNRFDLRFWNIRILITTWLIWLIGFSNYRYFILRQKTMANNKQKKLPTLWVFRQIDSLRKSNFFITFG